MRLPALAVGLLLPLAASAESPDSQAHKIRVSPETTHVAGPLTKDGYVDYRAYLNQKHSAGVNPEQNAVVWYWRAIGSENREATPEFCREVQSLLGADLFGEQWARMTDMGTFARQKVNAGELASVQAFLEMHDESTDGIWTSDELPLVAEWLKKNDRTLQLVEKAGQQPHYYTPITETEPLFAMLLPRIQLHRDFARMLSSRALLRAGEGDYDGASRDLISMYQLGEQTGKGNTLIEGLVGAAIYAITEDVLQQVITGTDISAKQLAALQKKLETIGPAYDTARLMGECERYFCLDAIQYASRSKPGEVFNLLDFAGLSMLENDYRQFALKGVYWMLMESGVDWNVALEQTNQYFDQSVAAMSLPTRDQRIAAAKEISNELDAARRESTSLPLLAVSLIIPESGDKRVGQFLLSSISPAFLQVNEAWCRAEVRRRVSPLGCAIERYRRVNGKYPANLQALVPSYIKQLPLDPYTDQSFHYRVNADRSQFAVYTFGPNEQDDNGATWGDSEGVQTDDMGMHSAGWLTAR
jgi:hypothetical protein